MNTDREPCTIVLCRGCCCGSHRKHPDVEHDAQVRRLREQIGDAARLRISDCLGPCERSNVVVVVPSRTARRAGTGAVWLGWVLDDAAIDAIATWVRAGGPGRCDPPTGLDLHRFSPPRRTPAIRP